MSGKQKQPYIPFYVGDYLTDTRILPLNVRGAWVDLILYMWNSTPKGEISGTIDDFARLIGCSATEIKFCIDLLNERKICDCVFLEENRMTLSSRKIKNIIKTSESRKNSGKMGGNPKLRGQTVLPLVNQGLNQGDNQNREYEYEYKDESNNNNNSIIKLKYEIFKKSLLEQQMWCEEIAMKTKSALAELPDMIDKFISHCIMGGESHYSEREFKTHFRNVCLSRIEIVKSINDKITQGQIDEKRDNFMKQVSLYNTQYDTKLLESFFLHWSQLDAGTNMMKWEKEKAFEIPNRLISWKEHSKKFTKNGSSAKHTESDYRDAAKGKWG